MPANPTEARISRSSLECGASDPEAALEAALGPDFARYREAFRRAEGGELPPFPVHLDADVTTRCNLGCPICPAGAGRGSYPGMGLDLDPGLYSAALREGEEKGLMSVRIGVTGEPLLLDSPHMWVEEAAARGMKDISLITNGQLLTPDVSRRLIGAGLTRLMVSADAGSEEGYRKARPGGDFRRLLENLRAFLAERRASGRGIPVLRASFVMRDGAESELSLFREKFSPLADYLSVQSYSPVVERGHMASEAGVDAAAATSPFPVAGARLNVSASTVPFPTAVVRPCEAGDTALFQASGACPCETDDTAHLQAAGGCPDSTAPIPAEGACPAVPSCPQAFRQTPTSVVPPPRSGTERASRPAQPERPSLPQPNAQSDTWCSEPFTRICLYADGGLFPCCSDYGRLWPAGSLLNGSVEEAWLSETSRRTREPGIPTHPACRLCRGLLDAGLPRPVAGGREAGLARKAG
ncbi:MAG: radical SAM protein [Deltaproteobacteria bacterium]|jgi:hypothetical protein|nr:radical SAM protein [Deltaproteobacteria bacterium]